MDRIDLFFFVVLILYLSYERFRDIATIETPVSVLLLYGRSVIRIFNILDYYVNTTYLDVINTFLCSACVVTLVK